MQDMPISEIIKTSLENVKQLADAGTIIGEPIPASGGTTIIPISKVSVGIASGGAEYGNKKPNDQNKNKFGGGGGTGLTVTPVGFLVISKDGNVRVLNVNANPADTGAAGIINAVDDIIDKTPDVISRIKDLFKKDKEEE